MKNGFLTFLAVLIVMFIGSKRQPKAPMPLPPMSISYSPPIKTEDSDLKIRLLVLKHSREKMADDDATLAIDAVRHAAEKGLDITSVGNHFINKRGKVAMVIVECSYEMDDLKSFVSNEMKKGATPGDTLIVFTIGHGFASGGLDNLGQRSGVMTALATAAEENQQRTLWWQLSCHANAALPDIHTLPENQQSYFSVLATSTADQLSAAYVQGRIMERVFLAMANKSKEIDPNQDGIITCNELRNFLNRVDNDRRGDLLFARSLEEPIFGPGDFANQLPIDGKRYPRGYIPRP